MGTPGRIQMPSTLLGSKYHAPQAAPMGSVMMFQIWPMRITRRISARCDQRKRELRAHSMPWKSNPAARIRVR